IPLLYEKLWVPSTLSTSSSVDYQTVDFIKCWLSDSRLQVLIIRLSTSSSVDYQTVDFIKC
ncbi:hypothetical protein BaRGS_00035996, partial [Batillaria attramentaria]